MRLLVTNSIRNFNTLHHKLAVMINEQLENAGRANEGLTHVRHQLPSCRLTDFQGVAASLNARDLRCFLPIAQYTISGSKGPQYIFNLWGGAWHIIHPRELDLVAVQRVRPTKNAYTLGHIAEL